MTTATEVACLTLVSLLKEVVTVVPAGNMDTFSPHEQVNKLYRLFFLLKFVSVGVILFVTTKEPGRDKVRACQNSSWVNNLLFVCQP